MIIDTSVLIRYFTNDEKAKALRFEKFLKTGRKIELTDVVVAELYWTLQSFYNFGKKQVLTVIESLINFRSIQCSRRLLKTTASLLRENNLSFIDAHIAACSLIKCQGKVLSYDKDFDKLTGISRIEP